ncbi:hypothetical protein U1Q18_022673, partial [Sarracenia purpurea var. burkii]
DAICNVINECLPTEYSHGSCAYVNRAINKVAHEFETEHYTTKIVFGSKIALNGPLAFYALCND